MRIVTNSSVETEQLGERIASHLSGGEVLALFGPMGMGKTAFTRGVARGLGVRGEVSSPTFALVHQYGNGEHALYHFDMYRVESYEDLYSTGFFDYLDYGGILAIEWSENIESVLPPNTITVEISRPQEGDDPDLRRILIRRP